MEWLTSKQAAEQIQLDVSSIQRAAGVGDLHGHRRTGRGGELRRSQWRFHSDALDVYIRGGDEQAQKRACGCDTLQVRPSHGRRLLAPVTR